MSCAQNIKQQVNQQVSTHGGDTASIILIVTDGKLQDMEVATTQVYTAEQLSMKWLFIINIAI